MSLGPKQDLRINFKKKIQPKSNLNLEKRYQVTILCLLSIFQTWDLKKSLVKIPGDQKWFESSKKPENLKLLPSV